MSRLRPHLAQLEGHEPLVALHLRTGFVDWKHWNNAERRMGSRSQASIWREASAAEPMNYTQQWQSLEAMLLDCSSALHKEGSPCVDWKAPLPRKAPSILDGRRCIVKRQRGTRPAVGLAAPGNGTLAAALACASNLARQMRGRVRPPHTRRRMALNSNSAGWGLLVLSDSPGVISLVEELPSLRGRVVSTMSDPDSLGNTKFGFGEGWTKSIIDLYLGGLADGLVTVLFSSYRRAMLRRSLLCCKETFHFRATANRRFSSRDRSMSSAHFLQALMQVAVRVPQAASGVT